MDWEIGREASVYFRGGHIENAERKSVYCILREKRWVLDMAGSAGGRMEKTKHRKGLCVVGNVYENPDKAKYNTLEEIYRMEEAKYQE